MNIYVCYNNCVCYNIETLILITMAEQKKVTIYSTPTCTYCNAAKEFFKKNNISYAEHNVGTDLEKRKEMVEKSGQLGVPVIDIGGEVIVGFDKPRISGALGVS